MRLLLLLLLFPGCTSSRVMMTAPDCVVERDGIVIRAETREAAEAMVGVLADIDRRVRHRMSPVGMPTPQLWLLDHELPETMVAGFSPIPPVIGIARGFHLSLHPIGHELAHVYLGEWPARLPVPIEEGVADLVGGEASGTLDPIRGQHAQVLANCRVENVVGLLAVSRREFLQVPTRQIASRLRAVGFSIADRAGLDTIRALSRMAADQGLDMIPADWFLPYWNEPSGS